MPRPPRKPFWRWTPLPWLVLVLLMLAAGTVQDAGLDAALPVSLVVVAVFAAAAITMTVAAARRRDPHFTAEGALRSVVGLDVRRVVEAGHPISVEGVRTYRHAIDAARARAGQRPYAVLVPGVGNGWTLRDDVAVYLLAGEAVYRAGRLNDRAQLAWQAELNGLRARGLYAAVPAEIVGEAQPFRVDVRLDGLRELTAVSGV